MEWYSGHNFKTMRKTITKDTLDTGDMVEHQGVVYLVQLRARGLRCSSQCSLFDPKTQRCDGICWRWENFDEVVFRRLLPTQIVKEDAALVITDSWQRMDGIIAERNREMHYQANIESRERGRRGPKPGHGGRNPQGGIIWDKGADRWRAGIRTGGKAYYKTSKDKAVVEAWLDEKRKELGIVVKGGGNVQ